VHIFLLRVFTFRHFAKRHFQREIQKKFGTDFYKKSVPNLCGNWPFAVGLQSRKRALKLQFYPPENQI